MMTFLSQVLEAVSKPSIGFKIKAAARFKPEEYRMTFLSQVLEAVSKPSIGFKIKAAARFKPEDYR